jgi:Ca2+-binding RTX toxin-like protein
METANSFWNGANNKDLISGFMTPSNFDLNQDEYNVDHWAGEFPLDMGLDSNLYPVLSDDIAYVGGYGDDDLTGTDNNDALYGGAGDDILDGDGAGVHDEWRLGA